MGHVEFGPRHLLRLGGIDVQLGVDDKLSFAAPMRILLQTSKLDFALDLEPAVLLHVLEVLLALQVQHLAIEVL